MPDLFVDSEVKKQLAGLCFCVQRMQIMFYLFWVQSNTLWIYGQSPPAETVMPVYNASIPSLCSSAMNEQLQPLKKPARNGKAGRSGTQDDIVYAHIFEAILEQRLAPGTKLSEEALGEIFGVSRTIIRRALSRLAHESVVLLRPNRGAVVASPTVDEARQVFFSRRLVERAITELAVQHATLEQLNELRHMVREERDSFSRGDRGAGIRLSGEFHLKLAEAAGNAPLVSFQRSLVSQTSLIIAQYESGNRSHCSYDEHMQLIDAIEARDAEQAVSLMMHHMDHIDSKLNLDEESASDDLHAVFSHLLQSKKRVPGKG